MKGLQTFNNEEFGSIRTVTINEEIYFVGKDVAGKLGYQNGSRDINRHVSEEDRIKDMVFDGNQNKETILINESGLYALIFGSKLESAKRFKRWVTSEVLPEIRKNGGYQIPMTTEGQIRLLAQGHTELVQKINEIDNALQNFKKDMPLLGIECQRITRAKNQKVVPLMGGKNAPAYKDNSLRGKVYSDIDAQLRRAFGVASYKEIKRMQCDLAVKIIGQYELPMALASQVELANNQMSF